MARSQVEADDVVEGAVSYVGYMVERPRRGIGSPIP